MKDLLKRLTSRKFLLTVGGALILIANQQWNELALLLGSYIGIEGASDTAARFAQQKYVAPVQKQADIAQDFFTKEDDDDVDKDSAPVPGM